MSNNYVHFKSYNPCGDLTGKEHEICNAALTTYFDLPFVQVMRNIVLDEISSINLDENSPNAQKILDWATYSLNNIESRASINFNSTQFETLTPLQIGLFKYFIHLLYENRYNIFYNRLVNFCAEENISIDSDVERILDKTAKVSDYFISFIVLTENFKWNLSRRN